MTIFISGREVIFVLFLMVIAWAILSLLTGVKVSEKLKIKNPKIMWSIVATIALTYAYAFYYVLKNVFRYISF